MKSRHLKFVAAISIAAFSAFASADLKITATVSGTAAGLDGSPAAGSYEIDYQGSRARVVLPNKNVVLYDFQASQVAILDTSAQTYTVTTIAAYQKSSQLGSVQVSNANETQSLAGYSAYKFEVGPSAVASNGPRQNGPRAAGLQFTQNQLVSYAGEVWLTEAGSYVASSAPFVSIAAPKSLAASFSKAIDSKKAVPLKSTLNIISPTNGQSETLSMAVDSIETTTLDTSTTQIPPTYKQATTS